MKYFAANNCSSFNRRLTALGCQNGWLGVFLIDSAKNGTLFLVTFFFSIIFIFVYVQKLENVVGMLKRGFTILGTRQRFSNTAFAIFHCKIVSRLE